MRCVALFAAAALSACSTTTMVVGAEPTTLWRDDAPQGPVSDAAPFTQAEARKFARSHDAPFNCEQSARSMMKKQPERGWALMHECILRSDFTDLELLVESGWADYVNAAPDSARLLAHVIAVRGGDVDNDLRILRRRKLPLYSLQAALAEPGSYRGRHVLVRASARDPRLVEGARAMRLVETVVMAESEWVTPTGKSRLTTRTRGERADANGIDVRRGAVDQSQRDESEKVEILHDVSVETGREVLARLPGEEPSLEPATDYIVLLRFEGITAVKAEDAEDADDVNDEATAVVVDYFEPEHSRFARLGR
jgi:hypothetical protein